MAGTKGEGILRFAVSFVTLLLLLFPPYFENANIVFYHYWRKRLRKIDNVKNLYNWLTDDEHFRLKLIDNHDRRSAVLMGLIVWSKCFKLCI